MRADPSLFFQIAAGLIPVLLFAGAVNQAIRPSDLLEKLGRRGRQGVVAAVAAVVAAALTAEFFAIVEAVNGAFFPSTFRMLFVANVVAFLTILTGIGVVLPWIQAAKPRLPGSLALLLTLTVVVLSSTIGFVLLSQSIIDAMARRSDATA